MAPAGQASFFSREKGPKRASLFADSKQRPPGGRPLHLEFNDLMVNSGATGYLTCLSNLNSKRIHHKEWSDFLYHAR